VVPRCLPRDGTMERGQSPHGSSHRIRALLASAIPRDQDPDNEDKHAAQQREWLGAELQVSPMSSNGSPAMSPAVVRVPDGNHHQAVMLTKTLTGGISPLSMIGEGLDRNLTTRDTNGKRLGGVGMQLHQEARIGIYVAGLTRNGPAERSGVVALNDLLMSVDGQMIAAHDTLESVRELILGPPNTSVLLAFERPVFAGGRVASREQGPLCYSVSLIRSGATPEANEQLEELLKEVLFENRSLHAQLREVILAKNEEVALEKVCARPDRSAPKLQRTAGATFSSSVKGTTRRAKPVNILGRWTQQCTASAFRAWRTRADELKKVCIDVCAPRQSEWWVGEKLCLIFTHTAGSLPHEALVSAHDEATSVRCVQYLAVNCARPSPQTSSNQKGFRAMEESSHVWRGKDHCP